MNEDLQRIAAYGREHTDEFGGYWFNGTDRTYCVSLTGSLDQHEAVLATRLNLPERLRVQRCLHTDAELRELFERLRAEDFDVGDVDERGRPAVHGLSVDQRAGVLRVRVQAGRPDVSARLRAKYGPRLEVEEGDWLNSALA